MTALHIKYRPTKLKELVGQADAVKTIGDYLTKDTLPHCLLLTGPSGVGKTTVARILKDKMGCQDGDFHEINCASKDGPDQIREVPLHVGLMPSGRCRIWYLDEFQSLSRAGFCQQSLLKVMEDYPGHAYFVLAATDPTKIIGTIKTRCKTVLFRSVSDKDLVTLVKRVAEAEEKEVFPSVVEIVVDEAMGSPRQALVLLDAALTSDTEEGQLKAVGSSEAHKQAFDLAKAIFWEKPDPKKIMSLVGEMKGEDPEGVRNLILACTVKEFLKGGRSAQRALAVYENFQFNYFDTRYAGLVASCYRLAYPS